LLTSYRYEGLKPVRFSGPYRAERAFMFTQAKAWAEFSWPFGPRAAPSWETPRLSRILRPEGPREDRRGLQAGLDFLWTTALNGRERMVLRIPSSTHTDSHPPLTLTTPKRP
jgi:hypothetical protein